MILILFGRCQADDLTVQVCGCFRTHSPEYPEYDFFITHLCIGLAEKDGKRLYDSVLLIDDTGQILLKHRKINLLSELMTPPYTAGDDVHVVETKFGKIGLLICADTHDHGILKRMAAAQPDLLLVPYGYAASGV